MKFNIPTLLFALLLISSCNLPQKKMEQGLSNHIQLFNENKDNYNNLIEELGKNKLLLSPVTLRILEKSKLSQELQFQIDELEIKLIKYGRFSTCDTMPDDSREMFFYLKDNVAIWYCPCIEQSDKNHFDDNSDLQGYKDLIEFYSLGLGGNWAIVIIKNQAQKK